MAGMSLNSCPFYISGENRAFGEGGKIVECGTPLAASFLLVPWLSTREEEQFQSKNWMIECGTLLAASFLLLCPGSGACTALCRGA